MKQVKRVVQSKIKGVTRWALWLCLVTPCFVFGQERGVTSENRLFHIERSKNRNMVCYDVNVVDGKLDTKKPLEVYWVNQEEKPGQVNGLSAIEKRFAYGYKTVSRGDDYSEVTLTAYPGRVLMVKQHASGYICTVEIDGVPAILKKLYVQAKAGNSLSVEYVELFGIAIDSGEELSERVTNKEK
ncbi:MAG: DUF4833 domain-containing protein [Tannerellaceae bacterium]|nr:DUF4833 domain-containing protein [Tannerellaceae bacterium]